MGDVNYRMRSFYDRGRQDTVNEIVDYLERVAELATGTKVGQEEDLSRVVRAIKDVIQKRMSEPPVPA
jgi:hypothetical protein